ncbi:MAG: hypothetical protein AB7O32_00255 [Vicinamibacterales bacterium]
MATPQERIDAATKRVIKRLDVLAERPGVDLARRLQAELLLVRGVCGVLASRVSALGFTEAQFNTAVAAEIERIADSIDAE